LLSGRNRKGVAQFVGKCLSGCSEKKQKPGDAYEPMVKLSTKKTTNQVIIIVEDNGMGIPAMNL
jgi:DNA topoisomerase VI subunit B